MTIKRYPDYIQGLDGTYFVSAESILRHGRYSFAYPPPGVAARGAPIIPDRDVVTVRTTGDGPYAQRYQAMHRQVMERVRSDPDLGALLKLPSWNTEQRQQWEARLAGIVTEVHRQDPVLGNYRLTDPPKVPTDFDKAVTDPSTWYVCEQMAVTKSMLMQQAEQEMLGRSQGGGLKRVGQYFIQAGDAKPAANSFGHVTSRHANIISSATGAVIEATVTGETMSFMGRTLPLASDAPYRVHVNPNFTADHAFAGYPMLTRPAYAFTRDDGTSGMRFFFGPSVTSFNYGTIDTERSQGRMQQRYELLRAGRTGDGEFTPYRQTNGGVLSSLSPESMTSLASIFGGEPRVITRIKTPGEVAGQLQDEATEQCEADCSWPAISARLSQAGLPTEPSARDEGANRLPPSSARKTQGKANEIPR